MLINALIGFFGSIWNVSVYHNIETIFVFYYIFYEKLRYISRRLRSLFNNKFFELFSEWIVEIFRGISFPLVIFVFCCNFNNFRVLSFQFHVLRYALCNTLCYVLLYDLIFPHNKGLVTKFLGRLPMHY